MHDVRVVTTHAVPTAVVARATTWAEFRLVWTQLLDQVYLFLSSGTATHTGRNVMLYKDDVPNIEVGVEIQGTFPPGGPVIASTLPAGEAAMTVHSGSYAGLDAAHRAVLDWCTANGRQLAGPRWEIYGDWHEDPAQILTQVYYLLT